MFEHRPEAGASPRFLAAWAGRLFDISASLPDSRAKTVLGTGWSSDDWVAASMTNPYDTNFLVMANGQDAPIRISGAQNLPESAGVRLHEDFSDPLSSGYIAPTEFRADTLAGVLAFKNRLWWWERSSARLWYGGLHAPGGRLSPFYISGVVDEGGSVRQLARLSRDGGDGPDDFLVVLLDTGRAIVYQGTDPDTAGQFAIVGRFDVGLPMGRLPMVQFGADLLCLTRTGLIPISEVIAGRGLGGITRVSNLISGQWERLVQAHGAKGWSACLHPDGSKLVVQTPWPAEAPDDGLPAGRQLVLHLDSGAWSEWRGLDAGVWAAFDGGLFFALRERPIVCRADSDAFLDDGRAIPAAYVGAFSYMPNPAAVGVSRGAENFGKRVHGVLPQILSRQDASAIGVGAGTDFEPGPQNWETAPLQQIVWGSGISPRRRRSVAAQGRAISPRLRARDAGGMEVLNLSFHYGPWTF